MGGRREESKGYKNNRGIHEELYLCNTFIYVSYQHFIAHFLASLTHKNTMWGSLCFGLICVKGKERGKTVQMYIHDYHVIYC